jgi:SH3-like domain-containing protein
VTNKIKEKNGRRSLFRPTLASVGVLIVAAIVYPLVMSKPVMSNPVPPNSGVVTPAILPTAAGFQRGRETGLLVPRFVSLKSRQARMRIGPSLDYATEWIYKAPGLALEITEEYGHWRRVRDYAGISGWMYGTLLSGYRTGVIGPWLKTTAPLRADPEIDSTEIAKLEARVRLNISSCDGRWCHVRLQKHDLSGYVRQSQVWGVYPGEIVK